MKYTSLLAVSFFTASLLFTTAAQADERKAMIEEFNKSVRTEQQDNNLGQSNLSRIFNGRTDTMPYRLSEEELRDYDLDIISGDLYFTFMDRQRLEIISDRADIIQEQSLSIGLTDSPSIRFSYRIDF